MIDALKFVQGAMRANKIQPELEHYQIKGGQVVGYNGYMALGAPIDLDLEAKPKGRLFYRAIEACGDVVSMGMTDGARLHIRSGAFSAYIPCIDHDIYEARPEGDIYACPESLPSDFRRLLPIISEDASRPWAMGLQVDRGTFTATNNVVINQLWTGHDLPTFNLPRFAVAEIVRIKQTPTHIQVSPQAVTFHYPENYWLRTQLLSGQWPNEIVDKILEGEGSLNLEPVPDGLFDALEKLIAFVPPETTAVRFEEGRLATGGEGAGAQVAVAGLPAGPRFSAPMLKLIAEEMRQADFSAHPNPCRFQGERNRGVILGMRA